MDAKSILRTAETLLEGAAGAKLPPPWGIVLAGLGAAAGLVADLVELGHEPVVAITAIRSILPSWQAADGRLADYVAAHAAPAPKASPR